MLTLRIGELGTCSFLSLPYPTRRVGMMGKTDYLTG